MNRLKEDPTFVIEKKTRRTRDWLSYSEAKKIVKGLNLKSVADYELIAKEIRRFLKLPADPSNLYRDEGWEGWPVFLGVVKAGDKYKIDNFVSFNKAKDILKGLGIKNTREFRSMDKEHRLLLNLPSNPDSFYRDKGWKSWTHFFESSGTRGLSAKLISFYEARQLVKELGVETIAEYKELSSEKKRHYGLPSNPGQRYKEKGWEGWPHFFGREDLRADNSLAHIFKAKESVKELGLKCYLKYKILPLELRSKLGLPSSLQKYYKKKGWAGWDDYFGRIRKKFRTRKD
jgi:hypothetical protein